MGKLSLLLACILSFGQLGGGETVTLSLMQDLSSELPTGTPFRAKDTTGKIFTGHVVTHRARFFLRRGSLMLVFDEPVVAVTRDPEGMFRPGSKMRLLKLGASLAAAKLADDCVDGAIGPGKARYVAASVGAALIIFQKGSDVTLREGTTIDVEPARPTVSAE